MRVLILTFYYSPDLSANSFRSHAVVEHLRNKCSKYDQIDVITSLPNRYSSFKIEAAPFERQDNVTIHRIALPSHQSGMLDQARAFAQFARKAYLLVQHEHYDIVFATSARLMTATLGAWLAHKTQAKLYLDIRDIFVESIHDVLPRRMAYLAKIIFSCIEKWTFSKAKRLNLVSRGFQNYFEQRYPMLEKRWFSNGIDTEFINIAIPTSTQPKEQPYMIVYAGNIGEAQGLHLIIPALAKRLTGKVIFRIIGDGGRKAQLKAATKTCMNVELLPPMSRKALIQEYQNADILFLQLNDYPAFYKSLPSKIFEYAATGRPIWAGVSGFAAQFLANEVSNCAIFHPCNIEGALSAFEQLHIKSEKRTRFIEKYARDKIMNAMAEDILSVSRTGPHTQADIHAL